MPSSWQINRRTMLRGLGVSIALPLLDVMESRAAPTRPPARAAFLYIPNGVAEGSWAPTKVGQRGELLKLSPWMSPLEPFKRDLVIPQNMWTPHGNGHGAGTATWLTGHGYDGRKIDVGGASVDQLAAQQIGQDHPLPSLELSMRGEGYFSNSLPRNNISWSRHDMPCSREVEPRRVFDRIFGRSGGKLVNRSILDLVLEDARRVRSRVSDADKRKVDEYLESIRSIERRLDFAKTQSERAAKDKELTDSMLRPKPGIPTSHQEYVRLMLDMVVLAFWSDATRVCTFMLDHGQSNRYFNFIEGVQGTWHALSHYKDISGETEDDDGKTSWKSVVSKRDMYNAVSRWHHEQVAYLLGRLKQVRDGEGTLLDNSMILYGSSLSDGHEHGAKDLPILLAGSGGGSISTGRSLKFRRATSMSKLYLSMLQGLGVKTDRFADAGEPLQELRS